MPRGIPNAKRDDLGMKYTTFSVPLLPNPKNAGSSYLKTDQNTLWARNATRANKSKVPQDLAASAQEGRRGSKVLVIHPGSRWLRIGRASDVAPVTVPNVIARKNKDPLEPRKFEENVVRLRKGKERAQPDGSSNGDEYAVVLNSDDPVEGKIAAIQSSLRDRMRFYKLRVTTNAALMCSSFNEQFKGETVADNDAQTKIDWIVSPASRLKDCLVCEEALKLANPSDQHFTVRYPMYGSHFNLHDYNSRQCLLDDIEEIWRSTVTNKLKIDPESFKDFSVVLVIPDIWERSHVNDLARIILINMGFKQLCCQQESLAATYGAGISNACVVDIGSVKTSVSCIDDGLVIADTRMSLNVAGDDVTEFLYVLLDRISFPYKDIDLARSYDWSLLEDIKSRICTLNEIDVALNLYDFVVRRPSKRAEKYGLRAYDEVILAPMCLFEPRVVNFEEKRKRLPPTTSPDLTDEIIEHVQDRMTHAMIISTQHLMPQPDAHAKDSPPQTQQTSDATPMKDITAAKISKQTIGGDTNKAPAITASNVRGGSNEEQETENGTTQAIKLEQSASSKTDASAELGDIDVEMVEVGAKQADGESRVTSPPDRGLGIEQNESASGPAETSESQSQQQGKPSGTSSSVSAPLVRSNTKNTSFLGNLPIDVVFEASKLPLDVAIFNSARAAGGDDKIRKYLQAVLVVGGTALVPGMAHALESRLQAIAMPLVPNMEKVQIIPPPKDVDPRLLVWKGAAVLGKMDGVNDLWVTAADWDLLGLRALKERCYFL